MSPSISKRYTDDEAEKIAAYSRETYDEFLADYLELHETVSETKSRRIFADTHGHELNEWAEELGLGREAVAAWHHDQADGADYSWVAADPVVLLKDD